MEDFPIKYNNDDDKDMSDEAFWHLDMSDEAFWHLDDVVWRMEKTVPKSHKHKPKHNLKKNALFLIEKTDLSLSTVNVLRRLFSEEKYQDVINLASKFDLYNRAKKDKQNNPDNAKLRTASEKHSIKRPEGDPFSKRNKVELTESDKAEFHVAIRDVQEVTLWINKMVKENKTKAANVLWYNHRIEIDRIFLN